MKPISGILILTAALVLSSCARKDSSEAAKASGDVAAPAQSAAAGPHAFVHLQDGSKVPGTVVASTAADVVVMGDDGIERKIPLTQVKSIEYAAAEKPQPASPAPAAPVAPAPAAPRVSEERKAAPPSVERAQPRPPAEVTTRTHELPAGSELSVRTNEPINSSTAEEGQTFDAQVTRDARDADGDIVIPRGADARIVIKSSSKGGRFRGASDLVLDLQSVSVHGNRYVVDTADMRQQGKSGVGANKRTAEYTGGGAALGAIIGAIAGGGKGAAIGAGAGAGAGAVTQIVTKGGAIKIPAESVLTFRLDRALKVNAAQ